MSEERRVGKECRAEWPKPCCKQEVTANRSESARSKCVSPHRCNAMASADRRFQYCALQNIRDQAGALSYRAREQDRGRDNTVRCNRLVPFGSRPPQAPRGPCQKHENVLCPDDSSSFHS